MATRTRESERRLRELLTRDHTLNGGILFGLDGYVIEVQARAMQVLRKPAPWTSVTDISGMAGVAVRVMLTRVRAGLRACIEGKLKTQAEIGRAHV